MKSREISRSKIGPFSLAYTDPYIGKGWEYQSKQKYRFERLFSIWVETHKYYEECDWSKKWPEGLQKILTWKIFTDWT